ncbi:MAG: GspMb/PilO family protein [Acidobacteriota bacterium]
MNLDRILLKRLPLLLLLGTAGVVVNLLIYAFGVSRLDVYTRRLKSSVEANRVRLQELEGRTRSLEETAVRLRKDREVIGDLAEKVLLTPEARLVAAQEEIQRLVEANQLELQSLSYTYETLPKASEGAWPRSYVKVTLTLPLSGTYPAMKSFVRALLNSPQFFTVEEMALAGNSQGGPTLRMNLLVSTLFVAGPHSPGEAAP